MQQTVMKKQDLRIVKTRSAIHAAFKKLLDTTNYNDITVTAIAAQAKISRKTFYQHYPSIEDLLKEIVRDSVNEIIDELRPSEDIIDIEDVLENFTRITLTVLKDNPYLNNNLMHAMPLSALLLLVRDPLIDACKEEFAKRNIPDAPFMEYWISYYLGGLCSVFETWKQTEGKTSSVDDLARIVTNMATQGVAANILLR